MSVPESKSIPLVHVGTDSRSLLTPRQGENLPLHTLLSQNDRRNMDIRPYTGERAQRKLARLGVPGAAELIDLIPTREPVVNLLASDNGDKTNAAKSHYTVNFVTYVDDKVATSGEDFDAHSAYKSSKPNHLYTGALLFTFTPPNGTSYPNSRITLHDLNQDMFREFVRTRKASGPGTVASVPEAKAAYLDPDTFLHYFQFVGVSANQAPELGTNSGVKTVTALDETRKGEATVLNVWGNNDVCLRPGQYLWIGVRWALGLLPSRRNAYPPAVQQLCAQTLGCYMSTDITSSDLISMYQEANRPSVDPDSTSKFEPCSKDDWFVHLIPICTEDDRPPLHLVQSPRGPGRLIRVGRLLSFPGDTIPPDHQTGIRACFHDAYTPSLDASVSTTAPSTQDVDDLVRLCGMLHVFLNPAVY